MSREAGIGRQEQPIRGPKKGSTKKFFRNMTLAVGLGAAGAGLYQEAKRSEPEARAIGNPDQFKKEVLGDIRIVLATQVNILRGLLENRSPSEVEKQEIGKTVKWINEYPVGYIRMIEYDPDDSHDRTQLTKFVRENVSRFVSTNLSPEERQKLKDLGFKLNLTGNDQDNAE